MGTSVQLRLPVVKRSTSAPIAMQGWLHKQGSEGLMLWKKRWFVLAEYCLFYYKNSEEDRLLGSILLPSYKISPCSAIEGKIFRKKYSFKAEHANMRTYYFAADSREQMVQWMNAMSLATIAQQFNGFLQLSTLKRDKVNFHFGNNNTNCTTDVDATRNGLTGSMMLPCKARNSGSCSSGGGTTENSSSQPLYVNAPPKPRRVTDPSESSTDNDFSNANSPATNDLTFRDDREYQPPYVKKVLANVTQSQLNGMNESRTLNVYSRSPSVDPQPLTYSRCKVYKQSNADYEELYNLTIMNHNNSSNGSGSTNATQKCPSRMSFHANSSTIERSTKTPFGYRPRSVDFLEVPRKRNEGKTNSEYSMGEIRAQTNSRNYSQRVLASTPKSSIITDNSDSFYWSEERYAQNMRKSAQYLVAKKLSSPSDVMKELNEFNKLPLRSTMYVRSAGVANLTPKTNTLLEGCTVEVASGSDGRTHGAVDVRINSADKTNTGSVQPKQYSQQRSNYLVNAYKTDETLNRSDFIRSKSARIQREKDRDIADHTGVESTNRRRNSLHSSESADRTNPQQTQQREESMKRLLEWKQKMLQSPLSRKSSGSSNRGVAQNDLFSNYKRSNGHSTYLLENAIGIKIPERDGGLTRNNQSWPLSDGNEDELSNDTQNLTSTNIDTSPQPNRNYREHQQEGRNSMNLLRKFDSESSDDEVLDRGQEIRKRERSGSLLSSNDSSSTLIRMSPNNVDINHSRCTSPFPIKCTNGLLNPVQQLDSGYAVTNMESKFSDASRIKSTESETLRVASNDSPPTNIVQSRIRVFEKLPEPKPIETLCLREPLTASSAHKFNRAFVSSIKNDVNESDINLAASSSSLFVNEKRVTSIALLPNIRPAQDLENFEWNRSDNDDDYTKNVESGLQQIKDTSSYNHLSKESTCVHKNKEENQSLGNNETRQVNVHEEASISEEHYLPMTSKKTYSAPPGDFFYHTRSNSASSASQILILETLLSEDVENSYVEMTVSENGRFYHEPKKLQGVSTSANNISQKSPSHYEFLYKASSSNEPLYTEVNTTEKWSGNEESSETEASTNQGPTPPTQSILPDILNSSNTLRQLTDSSDADDEASKEFNPNDMPRNPRFSLSDTFRPASYYLGNNYDGGIGNDKGFRGCTSPYNMADMRNTLNLSFDQPDSSDSDLVSPPPIPTSPASLDDFEMSLDSATELVNGQHSSLSETESFTANSGVANGNNKPSKEKNSSDLESTTESNSSTITTLPETMYDDYNTEDKDDERTHETRLYKNMLLSFEGQMGRHRTQSCSADDVVELSTASFAGGVTHLGAPYYYADLLKLNSESAVGTAESAAGATSDHCHQKVKNRSQQEDTLNNKREQCLAELTVVSKRNNIGKKVNQIAAESNFSDNNYKMVAHLKNTVQLLRMTDKNVDDKNIYSSYAYQSKLHKSDFRSKTPEPLSDTVNLYTTTQNYRSNDGEISKNLPHSRRSRSLEGLLDGHSPKNNLVWSNSKTRSNECLDSTSLVPVLLPAPSTSSADIWEEDRLWRENLRRASLRHSRSLDDLDKDETKADGVNSGRQSADILGPNSARRNKNRLTREVTYVNDCVSLQMRKAKQNAKEYTEDYREVRRIKRYARPTPITDNVDDGVHYERLDPRAMLPLCSANHLRRNNGASLDTVSSERVLSNMKQHGKHNTQPKTGAQSFLEEGVYPTKPPSFEIDREKLRQWDLMSSAPVATSNAIQRYPVSDGQPLVTASHAQRQTTKPKATEVTYTLDQRNTPPPSPVYGSDSAIGHNTVLPPNTLQTSVNLEGVQQADPSVIDVASTASSTHYQQHHGRVNDVRSHSPHLSSDIHTEKLSDSAWNLDVSAGELLGRTHEELVLLLIQLRRQSASVCKAMENCHRDIENQATLAETETSKQGEYLNSVEDLKKRLNELEKQYEKGKPLVNLVDNMVKLGSLYRAGAASSTVQLVSGPLLEKLEFNHRVQEQRLLAEEQKEWERINPDHHQLQAKVEELYKLDRELQHESSTLQSLKQDKDLLENALGGLKHKIQGTQGNPTEIERYRRQQLLLERELSHVRSVLARNSNKLEETVTANSRLEAELVILRQKLQWSQRHSEDNLISAPAVAALENELKRVQMLVGDLQRQRNELSAQVRQLTEKSNNLSQQIRPSSTGIAGAGSVPVRKKANSGWTETDLDGDTTHDTSTDRSSNVMSPDVFQISAPLYANTKDRRRGDYFGNNGSELHYTKDAFCEDYHSNLSCLRPDSECGKPMDISESDDRTKRFYGILPREKSQEIKTVRIVKRESERRQRDRDRTGNVGIPVSLGVKRAAAYGNSMPDIDKNHLLSISEERERDVSLLYGCGYRKAGFSPTLPDYVEYRMGFESFPGAVASTENITSDKTHQDETPRTIDSQRGQDVPVNKLAKQSSDSPQLSPVYQSEAAKRIVQELVSTPIRRKDTNKRLVPKGKRRHHTVSSSKPLISAETYATHITRARDDVDMERALRPRLNAAPDVVRSTLSRTEPLRYNAETIDSVIGLPDKIFIPERYMPETEPELSPEEQNRRLKKADTIRKMLSETTTLASVENSERNEYNVKSLIHKKKFEEDRKQRDHILHLNQILAQQVTEKSKLVAGAILSNLS